MLSTRFHRWATAVLTASALALPGHVLAQTPDHPADSAAQFPTKSDLKSMTTAGSYLAARHASVERDAGAAAAFYRSALRTDPKNNELLDRAFISSLADGDIDEAVKLADRILTQDKSNRVARLVVGVRDLKQKKYATAQLNINQSIRGPITDLVATLLSAWASYGAGDSKAAVANIDKLTGPEWYPIFKDLHAGLILELANREKDAGSRLEKSYKLDDSMLRVVDAWARWNSRNKDGAAATAVYEAFEKKLPRHPLVQEGLKEIRAGKKLGPLVDSAQAGAAEALYGIGATLTRRGGEDLALVYLQLSLYLSPTHPMALLSLADLYESVKKPAMAIKVYERVPANSPLKRNAQIQLATNLDAVDRSEEGIKILRQVIDQAPKDIEAIMALGNIERGRKKFADCAVTYSRGIDAMPATLEKNAWVTYYYRGICLERSKQWSKAEADMRKALELQPEQPHVLNYLGYSWIDQGVNLDEGMKMIRRAVDQRPDDGYIVDSLGWAYYRIGNYEDAVKHLERAIDLKPEDPTINDHLGDAYWRVGRTLEAKFQWSHARDLKPEPEELPKIEAKIENGLPEDTSSSASAGKKKEDGKGARSQGFMSGLVEEGRAKVNLTLRVVGRRTDGYHDLESVVAFADCADKLTLTPGPELSLKMIGPLATACGETSDNLVLKAARLLGEVVPGMKTGAFVLDKLLPVAAGIGGGSADAAAALRLLARLNNLPLDDERMQEVALEVGADVPVCLVSRACDMTGVGENLLPLNPPKMPSVLVNPGVPVATKDVFAALGLRHGELRVGVGDVMTEASSWPEEGGSLEEWVEALASGTNDLEEPAMKIQPVIGKVITALNATNGAWLARMSGSGATCFALYENTAEAGRAADKIRSEHPSWWVHAGTLS